MLSNIKENPLKLELSKPRENRIQFQLQRSRLENFEHNNTFSKFPLKKSTRRGWLRGVLGGTIPLNPSLPTCSLPGAAWLMAWVCLVLSAWPQHGVCWQCLGVFWQAPGLCGSGVPMACGWVGGFLLMFGFFPFCNVNRSVGHNGGKLGDVE